MKKAVLYFLPLILVTTVGYAKDAGTAKMSMLMQMYPQLQGSLEQSQQWLSALSVGILRSQDASALPPENMNVAQTAQKNTPEEAGVASGESQAAESETDQPETDQSQPSKPQPVPAQTDKPQVGQAQVVASQTDKPQAEKLPAGKAPTGKAPAGKVPVEKAPPDKLQVDPDAILMVASKFASQSRYGDAIAVVELIPADSSYGMTAKQLQKVWANLILERAKNELAAGRKAQAVATLKSIPQNSLAHAEAGRLLAKL
jgi:hypothetical protein